MEESELRALVGAVEQVLARQTITAARVAAIVTVLEWEHAGRPSTPPASCPIRDEVERLARQIADEMLRSSADFSPALASRLAGLIRAQWDA